MYVYIYIYIYIHICVCVLCVPLRAEGYERMWSSQTSFSILWYWKLLQFFSLSLYLRHTLIHIHTHRKTHTLSLSFSLCVVALSSVVSFFLFRSFTFSLLLLFAARECFCNHLVENERWKLHTICKNWKWRLRYLSEINAVLLCEREERDRERKEKRSLFFHFFELSPPPLVFFPHQ